MDRESSARLALSGVDRKGEGAKGGEQHGSCQLGNGYEAGGVGEERRQGDWGIERLIWKVIEPWVQKSRIRCCVIVFEFWDTQLGLDTAISCMC